MGRQMRRVPRTWQHPRNAQGAYIPMYEFFPYDEDEIRDGLANGWLVESPPLYGLAVMPQWPAAERTHVQLYEDTTEGTPMSPVCATVEELARWVSDHQASWFAGITATYEEWLSALQSGTAGVVVFSMPSRKEEPDAM
jgi:hypothetical protein